MKKTTCGTEKNIFRFLVIGTLAIIFACIFIFIIYQFVVFYTTLAGGATPYWIPLFYFFWGCFWFCHTLVIAQKSIWTKVNMWIGFVWLTIPISMYFLAKGSSFLGYTQSANTFFEYRYITMWYALPVLLLFFCILSAVRAVQDALTTSAMQKKQIQNLFIIHLDQEILITTLMIDFLKSKKPEIVAMYSEGSTEVLAFQNRLESEETRIKMLLERKEFVTSL